MARIVLENTQTGEIYELPITFEQAEYLAALHTLGITGDREELMAGENLEHLRVAQIETDVPREIKEYMLNSNNPVQINMAQGLYDNADEEYQVDEYISLICDVSDLADFCNLCLQSDQVYYRSFSNGYGYEGFGRELIEYMGAGEDIPEWALDYFDYEEYGRCSAEGGDYYIDDYGYIDGYDMNVDLSLYSPDELLIDEFEWQVEFDDEEWEQLCDEAKRIAEERQRDLQRIYSAKHAEEWRPDEVSIESLIQIL